MKLRDYWRQLPGWAKVAAILLPSIGVVGAIIGTFFVDVSDWWDPRGFGVNVATSLIGALVGIPLAVVVIGWFTTNHVDSIEVAEITNSTERAWSEFHDAALRTVPPTTTSSLVDDSKHVDALVMNLQDIVRDYAEYLMRSDGVIEGVGAPEELVATLAGIGGSTTELKSAIGRVRGAIGSVAEHQSDWADLRIRWTYLSTEVRRQRYGHGLGWIPIQYELGIEVHFENGSPLADASSKLDGYEELVRRMDRVPLSSGIDLTNPQLLGMISSSVAHDSLTEAAARAASRMLEFRRVVLEANADVIWRSPAKAN